MRFKNISLIPARYARYGRWIIYPIVLAALFPYLKSYYYSVLPYNGFQLEDALIPAAKIEYGGPPRDGIPAIDKPRFVKAEQADFLRDEDRILGVSRNGIVKAYPVAILNHHEIVNDRFQNEPVVVSYCPLCGTGVAFSASVADAKRTFGVSGLLYNSDVLLYDRESDSLWSQILGKAISGPLQGEYLKRVQLAHTTWADWRQRHADTLILSTNTGYRRDYTRDPYAGYESSDGVYFAVDHVDPRYHPKELVIGLEVAGRYKAYPFSELAKAEAEIVVDNFADQEIRVEFDAENRTGRVVDGHGQELSTMIAYWFAWVAFHPESEVYRGELY